MKTGRSGCGIGISRAMRPERGRLDEQEGDARRRRSGTAAARTTAKSMLMPTAMKKRPRSRPLNGSMSVSSSRRYSLSASSTPARKAPSAIDRPTAFISAAVATTSSSEAAVKISGVSLLAIQRSAGRSRRRPPRMMTAMVPIALAAPSQPPPSPRAGGDGEERQQGEDRDRGDVLQQRDAEDRLARGRRHHVALGQHAQADRGRRHRQAEAADDREAPVDAAGERAPSAAAAPSRTAARCPSRRWACCSDQSRCGSSSRPTRNSISTTPNSAKCSMSCGLVTSFSPHGPIRMPAPR